MKPRALFHTAVALLVLGIAGSAVAQPDKKSPDGGDSRKQGQAQQDHGKQQAQQQTHGQQQDHGQPQARGQQQLQTRARTQTRQHPAAPLQRTAVRRGQSQGGGQTQTRQRSYGTQGRQAGSQAGSVTRTPQSHAASQARIRAQGGQNRQPHASRQVVSTIAPQRGIVTGSDQRAVWSGHRAQSWSTQHRSWVQRGGYSGYRIPSNRFSLYFGHRHHFRLARLSVRIFGDYPQFQEDGYWFTMLDPVPEYWSDDWYDTDDVEVVYLDDGYYLMNASYPNDMVAISVTIN